MSLLVLHMNKFKKDAVRGIQSHNRRERESHSNPDIDYARSAQNYDLHEAASENYAQAIQNRIDDLLMVKAVRKDAVHMCGLVVSSDREFFDRLNADETKRFFEEAAAYLTEFVGKENVISAMVHMDEKTPHMHFLHVPITKDGRLCAKDIYTKAALKKLQDELPIRLQKCGFLIERGVEQQKGSAKKHLDTKEFKQQQEMLASMPRLEATLYDLQEEVTRTGNERRELFEQNEIWRKRISEAEESLKNAPQLPAANLFNYKDVIARAQEELAAYQQALADKVEVARQRDMRARQAHTLLLERDKAVEAVRMAKSTMVALETENKKLQTRMAQVKEKGASEMKDMQDFILVSGNHLRFQEFQLQRMEERALEARARAEHERQVRQETERQKQSRGIRMR